MLAHADALQTFSCYATLKKNKVNASHMDSTHAGDHTQQTTGHFTPSCHLSSKVVQALHKGYRLLLQNPRKASTARAYAF
jgi:hypothetical protein